MTIHPDARVATPHVGEGTRIWQFVVVLPAARIGRDCNINAQVFIENDVIVGDRVTVKSGVQLWDGLRVEDDVFIGPNATFTNDLLPRSRQRPDRFLTTVLRRGCSLGANCTIVAGVTIGVHAMIGAGSVVTHDVPDFELWYGNPARRRGRVDAEGRVVERDGNE
jgi:acetyltransferase-like isoleucine patch superfamily enzyme